MALGSDVNLVAGQCVANLAELLNLGLENLLEPLVLQLSTFHLLPKLCKEKVRGVSPRVHRWDRENGQGKRARMNHGPTRVPAACRCQRLVPIYL